MTPPYADNPSADSAPAGAESAALAIPRTRRTSRLLIAALAMSLAAHLALSLLPVEIASTPESVPLQATITELPPPPAPIVVAKKPKPKRTVLVPVPQTPAEPAPIATEETPVASAPEDAAPPAPPPAAEPASMPDVAATEPPPVAPDPPPKELPPRVDLAYKVFLGTQGFLIGDATYRFEHAGNQYRITTVGQARGLAALLIRGQGKIESHGLITRSGLQPQEFSVERGSADRREVARFDWETGIVTLHEQQTAPLELSTFDPLVLMWQFYFSPPSANELSFSVATTRRVLRYSIAREGTETITWPQGEIETERWHRRSDDGSTDSYVWLAPSLHYVPVKLRIVATYRGTLEALLDSIRVDEPTASR
jgi:hypothetical protein